MKRNFSIAALVLILALVTSFAVHAASGVGREPLVQEKIVIESVTGESHLFYVEIADDPLEREVGLMHRTELPADSGMLFLFPEEGRPGFWMKNTLIPLDIIFIARDGNIHHIHSMAKPQDLAKITAKRPSVAVLEINGGLADQLGIRAGDHVLHPFFRNTLAE